MKVHRKVENAAQDLAKRLEVTGSKDDVAVIAHELDKLRRSLASAQTDRRAGNADHRLLDGPLNLIRRASGKDPSATVSAGELRLLANDYAASSGLTRVCFSAMAASVLEGASLSDDARAQLTDLAKVFLMSPPKVQAVVASFVNDVTGLPVPGLEPQAARGEALSGERDASEPVPAKDIY